VGVFISALLLGCGGVGRMRVRRVGLIESSQQPVIRSKKLIVRAGLRTSAPRYANN